MFSGFLREAEREGLPLIRERLFGPGMAQLVLALHAQMLLTGDPRVTPESMMAAGNSVIALWQAGYYTPGPDYPFTLEETLRDIQGGPKATGDYASSFQTFRPTGSGAPLGLGQVHGGIVRHPETGLWQVWMMLEGPCTFLAAYRDPKLALRQLETIINASRKGGSEREREVLHAQMRAQADGEPRQLPYDMMVYLVEHLDDFTIAL